MRKLLESNCAKLPDNSAQAETIEVDCTVPNCMNNSNNLGRAESVGNKPLLMVTTRNKYITVRETWVLRTDTKA